jgi:hypothetical protein
MQWKEKEKEEKHRSKLAKSWNGVELSEAQSIFKR